MRLYKCSFSGFLATRPKSAGVGLLFFASLRGKSVLSRRHWHSSLPRNGFLLYHKIRSAAENAARTRHARFPVQGATDRNLSYFHLQLILGITSYCRHYTQSAKRVNCASTFSIVLNCSVRSFQERHYATSKTCSASRLFETRFIISIV